jgi:hypothetical protein
VSLTRKCGPHMVSHKDSLKVKVDVRDTRLRMGSEGGAIAVCDHARVKTCGLVLLAKSIGGTFVRSEGIVSGLPPGPRFAQAFSAPRISVTEKSPKGRILLDINLVSV